MEDGHPYPDVARIFRANRVVIEGESMNGNYMMIAPEIKMNGVCGKAFF